MDILNGQPWHIHHGDCIPHMATMPPASVDMSVFSPPFPSLYAYSDSLADIGNSEDMEGDAKLHLSFFYSQLARIVKPGRVVMVHIMQIPNLKRTGKSGLCNFRDINIRLGKRAGLIYEYDWCVRKNPQALKNGTKVLTPDKWVEIQNLSVGDKVIGSDGSTTTVKGVHPHEPRTMYRVTFSDGTSVECDGKHLWQVQTINGPSKTMTTDEIRSFGIASECGDPRFKIPVMSGAAQLHGDTELPIDPYTLGVILGDGSITSRGSATLTCEHEVVALTSLPEKHSWRRIAGSDKGNGTVATYASNGDKWHSNLLLDGLRSLGLFGMRAWEKHVPESYKFTNAWNRLEVLRGLMDTDGTIKTNSGIVCKYCTTSEQLANDVAFLAQSLGGVTRIDTEDNSRYVHNGEERFGRRKYLVSLRMPEGCNPFKMPRKADRWQPTKKTVCRWIKSIEPTTVEPCTCIEVAAADSLYVTEHCIVTHNSQAIRTRCRELQFAGLEADRAKQRGCLLDYLIKFMAPGDNAIPINTKGEVSRNEWIDWAEGCWTDIEETDTLNFRAGKGEDDTKHICPLQLEVIRRLVLLYTNPGEIVFSPFTGVGSEGYMALGGRSPKTKKRIANPRRFYGCELKDEYFIEAESNLDLAMRATEAAEECPLFGATG